MTASRFAPIDLSALPAPQVIEELNYETILAARKAELLGRFTGEERTKIEAALKLESEPMVKLIEAAAYRELKLRQRINEGARAVMLAFATGGDLDQLAALHNVRRRTLKAGDPDAVPPVAPVLEDDATLRRLTQLAPEGFSAAGSKGAYLFHGLRAGATPQAVSVTSPEKGMVRVEYRFDPTSTAAGVRDVAVFRDKPGSVTVVVLARDSGGWADGTPLAKTLKAVRDWLSSDAVRPLTDTVRVKGAVVLSYRVKAKLTLHEGPDAALVVAAARAGLDKYVQAQHVIGAEVNQSGLHAALQVAGVARVDLDGWRDVKATQEQAPYCAGVTLTHE